MLLPRQGKNDTSDTQLFRQGKHGNYSCMGRQKRLRYPALSSRNTENAPASAAKRTPPIPSAFVGEHGNYSCIGREKGPLRYPALSLGNTELTPALAGQKKRTPPIPSSFVREHGTSPALAGNSVTLVRVGVACKSCSVVCGEFATRPTGL